MELAKEQTGGPQTEMGVEAGPGVALRGRVDGKAGGRSQRVEQGGRVKGVKRAEG